MSGALKLSIFSIVGILVFCIVGIFIPPVLLLSEAFSILCCIAISVSVISNIETNGENFLLKLSLALLISAGIQFVMRVIFYILGKNDLFSFWINSASAVLAALSLTATIFMMLLWLILKIFHIPADIIRSPFLKLGFVLAIGTIIFRAIGIAIKEFSLIAMVFFVLTALMFILAIFINTHIKVTLKMMLSTGILFAISMVSYWAFQLSLCSKIFGVPEADIQNFLLLCGVISLCVCFISFLVWLTGFIYRVSHSVWLAVVVLSALGLLISGLLYFMLPVSGYLFFYTLAMKIFGCTIGVGVMGMVFSALFRKK